MSLVERVISEAVEKLSNSALEKFSNLAENLAAQVAGQAGGHAGRKQADHDGTERAGKGDQQHQAADPHDIVVLELAGIQADGVIFGAQPGCRSLAQHGIRESGHSGIGLLEHRQALGFGQLGQDGEEIGAGRQLGQAGHAGRCCVIGWRSGTAGQGPGFDGLQHGD